MQGLLVHNSHLETPNFCTQTFIHQETPFSLTHLCLVKALFKKCIANLVFTSPLSHISKSSLMGENLKLSVDECFLAGFKRKSWKH
jgi:hypothetical protein